MSIRKSEQEMVDVFADLLNKTTHVQHHIPPEDAHCDNNVTKKYMPKVININIKYTRIMKLWTIKT